MHSLSSHILEFGFTGMVVPSHLVAFEFDLDNKRTLSVHFDAEVCFILEEIGERERRDRWGLSFVAGNESGFVRIEKIRISGAYSYSPLKSVTVTGRTKKSTVRGRILLQEAAYYQ